MVLLNNQTDITDKKRLVAVLNNYRGYQQMAAIKNPMLSVFSWLIIVKYKKQH